MLCCTNIGTWDGNEKERKWKTDAYYDIIPMNKYLGAFGGAKILFLKPISNLHEISCNLGCMRDNARYTGLRV